MSDPVLCYVRSPWAYFTTQPLNKQWGDDWNDSPYEHNAGEPYGPRKDKGEDYEIILVAWSGPYEVPCEYETNSRWSVEMINSGKCPWLTADRYGSGNTIIPPIMAGTTLAQFKMMVGDAGGQVYEKTVPVVVRDEAREYHEAIDLLRKIREQLSDAGRVTADVIGRMLSLREKDAADGR